MKLIGILAAAAGMMLLALSGHGAVSQMARTIRIVVPFPAGGSADELARLLADQIGRTRGVNFVIENRPGAGTVVATEAVSRAAPDGNTLLIVANSFVINPSLKKLSYDPFASFAPVCHLVSSPLIIAVNSDSPYRSLADLTSAAHAKPGELTLASVAPATTQHIAFEMLKRVADMNMIHVPYPGGAPTVTALLGEHVTAVIANYSEVEAHLASGKLRALATASHQRPSPNPATRTTRRRSGSAWSRPQRRPPTRSPSYRAGLAPRSRPMRSSRSCNPRKCIRSEPAARISPRICGSNSTNMRA
jgi:tripartite-type tricarboxylate transporter receptor subunit TctC